MDVWRVYTNKYDIASEGKQHAASRESSRFLIKKAKIKMRGVAWRVRNTLPIAPKASRKIEFLSLK